MKNEEKNPRQVKKGPGYFKVWFGGGARFYYLTLKEIEQMNREKKTEAEAEDFCKNLKD